MPDLTDAGPHVHKSADKSWLPYARGENFRPLQDRVLLKKAAVEKFTASGLELPAPPVDMRDEGVIVAVGPGAYNARGQVEPMRLRVGDRIIFDKRAVINVKVGAEELATIREGDVYGVVEKAGDQ